MKELEAANDEQAEAEAARVKAEEIATRSPGGRFNGRSSRTPDGYEGGDEHHGLQVSK